MGRFNFNFINSPERLKEAHLRNDKGELEGVSVDAALQTTASALQKVMDKAGGSAIGVICGGMLANQEYYLA